MTSNVTKTITTFYGLLKAIANMEFTYNVVKGKPVGVLFYTSCGYNVLEVTRWGISLLIAMPIRH